MKKLEHNVILTVPKEARKEIESQDISYIEKLTIEIYYKYDDRYDNIDWEVYKFKIIEMNEEFNLCVNKDVLEIIKTSIENDVTTDYSIELFLYEQLIAQIQEEVKEQKTRYFLEEISD